MESDMDERTDILVIDDCPENLDLLGDTLAQAGYQVRPVPSGDLALQAAQLIVPDLILLDVNMPDMDGYEVCRRLKDDPQLTEVPVIFVSAMDEAFDKVKAFETGAVDYITKPFKVVELLARIQTHLRLKAALQAQEETSQELQKKVHELVELQTMRDDLVHMIIHDMRSPLTGIINSLELCLHGKRSDPESRQRRLTNALTSAERLDTMVNSILDISRLESGETAIERRQCVFTSLINNAIDIVTGNSHDPRIVFVPPVNPVEGRCDPDLISRVLCNLIGNARKFTPYDGHILISLLENDNAVQIEVANDGPSIPADLHGRIFDKFSRFKHIDGQSTGGLGLNFCKLAVQAHNGRIWLESEEGKGCTFAFSLPQKG